MVNLWPWRGDQNSAESFERTLNGLSEKITVRTAKTDALRQRARKLKVGWTLYGGFTYILTALIFILVTGFQNWGALEYTTVAGGPVLLWGVRRLLTLLYDYRISSSQAHLDHLNDQRDATIEKLKERTKYNSTQQLIDKYSSKPSASKQQGVNKEKPKQGSGAPPNQNQRVFSIPPPTANIPRGPLAQQSSRPDLRTESQVASKSIEPPSLPGPRRQPAQPTAEFAPNAFEAPSAPPTYGEGAWYDRILDALLGEDETSAKNRFALICSTCRLVNGQAPPGAKTLQDVGQWRCSGCGGLNGVENETAKLVKQEEEVRSHPRAGSTVRDVTATPDDSEDSDREAGHSKAATEVTAPAASMGIKSKGKDGKS